MATGDPHCQAPGCTDPIKARKYCSAHLNRLIRYGDFERRRPLAKWSRKYEKCAKCGTDKVPHVGKGLCGNCGRKTWQQKNRSKERRRTLLRFYGLTPEQFESLWEVQEGRCKICKKLPPAKLIIRRNQLHTALQVDHDHKNKIVRGLLCGSCNRGLGFFFDDPDLLIAAAAYLKSYDMPKEANDGLH